MKKTFRSILAGALALLAVSCYDDSALRSALSALESRVTELENKLNTEVGVINSKFDGLEAAYKLADKNLSDQLAALNTSVTASLNTLTQRLDALDGSLDGYVTLADYNAAMGDINAYKETMQQKITELLAADKKLSDDLTAALEALRTADSNLQKSDEEILAALVSVGVTNVAKNEAGNVVITFVDKSTLEIPTKPQEGLVTVVEVEGEKFWAVVVNGEKKSLGVKVGHPDFSIEFEVDYDTNELLYSVNGGEFEGTGAFVADDQEYLFTDFYQEMVGMDYDTWEPIMSDYFVLVFGGVEYQLPVYKVDNSVVVIKTGKTYFSYGEEKVVDVVISEITSMYVMSKPDGWRAKLNGNKLAVTAPAEAAVVAGYAEADGEVLLHCTTADGKCKVAKLAVATTAGFSLTIADDGKITIVNPEVVTTINQMMGWEETDFNDAYMGLAPIAAFEADPKAFVENAPYDYENINFMINNFKQNTMDWETGEFRYGGMYIPGEYEVDVIEVNIADIYMEFAYSELPRGSQFVVWACPVDSEGAPRINDLVYGYYSPIDIKAELVGEPSFNEIVVDVDLFGADGYYVGKVTEEECVNYDMMTGEMSIDFKKYIMNQFEAMSYGYGSLGMFVAESGEYTYNLSEVVSEGYEVVQLAPDTKYYFYVIPVTNGKAWNEYKYADFESFVYDYTTTGLAAGGQETVSLVDQDNSFTRLEVELAATAGTTTVYYNFFASEEYDSIDDVPAELIANGYVSASTSVLAIKNNGVEPGASFVVAAIAVDENGQYGEVFEYVVSAPAIEYSETFVATVGNPVFTPDGSNFKVAIPVTVEGGTADEYYYYWNTSARTEEQLNNLPLGMDAYHYYYTVDVLPEFVMYAYQKTMQFAVVVKSATGELSKPVIITVNQPSAE